MRTVGVVPKRRTKVGDFSKEEEKKSSLYIYCMEDKYKILTRT